MSDLPATLSPRPASRGSAEADGLARRAGVREGQKDRKGGRKEKISDGYIYVPMIIALISFKISLMEGIFDGLILAGVCL